MLLIAFLDNINLMEGLHQFSSKNTTSVDLDVLAEQTSELFDNVYKAIFTVVINSIILVSVLWHSIEHDILIIWISTILCVSLLRGILTYQYKKTSPSNELIQPWTQRFIVGSIVSAVIWGVASIVLFPPDDLARQVFLAFVLGGMAAGAITSLSAIKPVIYIYLAVTLIPLIVRFVYSGTELNIAMGSMLSIYLVVLIQSANQSYSKNLQNINMRIDNIKQQRSLEQSEHRYETLLATATDAFFLHDLNGKFVDVNHQACRSLGYTRDELLSMSVSDIESNISTDDVHHIWSKLKENENIRLNGTHTRKDGTFFPVEVSLGSIHIDNEPFISVLARDVTERERIDKMKNEFISTVSHELRTPLTSIRGSIGLLVGGACGELPAKAKEITTIAANNTDRLLLLINDILDIQKIESGELIMKFENINILPFLRQSVEDNIAYAEQYGVTFSLQAVESNLYVNADKDRLMQVMANLLSNAAKFSHKNGIVEISASLHNEKRIKISITDHGEGIPKEFYSKIFGKFSQSDSSDTRQKGGSGLGLNISKAIIEKHGGTIGFESDTNKGTTFYFELPVSTVKNVQ